MSLMTNEDGKILTNKGKAINKNEVTMLEVENLINKKIIDLGTFATNGTIEEGLKEFFTAVENLPLGYEDNRVFIGMVANTKVMALGQGGGGDLAVYTENFKQYKVWYDDADILTVEFATPSIIQLGDVRSWNPTIDHNDLNALLKGVANQIYSWWLQNNINHFELESEKSVVFTGRIDEDPYIATFKNDDGCEVFIHCFGLWNGEKYETKDYYVRRGNENDITVTDLTNVGNKLKLVATGTYVNQSSLKYIEYTLNPALSNNKIYLIDILHTGLDEHINIIFLKNTRPVKGTSIAFANDDDSAVHATFSINSDGNRIVFMSDTDIYGDEGDIVLVYELPFTF